MGKYGRLVLLGYLFLLLCGCSVIPNLSGGNAKAVLMPQYIAGQYGTQTIVNPNLSANINHLTLELRYSPSLTLAANRDIPQAQLTNPIVFNNLRANTTYRVVATAYKTADTSQVISTADADSYIEFTTTNNDAPAIAPLKVRLTDVAFNGIGTGSIVVTPGGYNTADPLNVGIAFMGKVLTLAGVSPYRDGIGTDATFNKPNGMVAANGFLYIADTNNNLIRRMDLATNAVTTIAGGSQGAADGIGTAAQFNTPCDLAFDNGFLYVSDSINHRIRKIDLATNNVTTIAGSSYGYADGTGAAAQFYGPKGLVVASGSLYVADTSNNRIRKIDLATNEVTTFAGSTANFADGTGTAAQFYSPWGLVEANGFLYVTDFNNYRIRKISLSTSEVTTIAGQTSSGNADGTGTAAKFFQPYGLTVSNGSLYVADMNNNSIRKLNLSTNEVTTIAGSANGFADGTGTAAQFYAPCGVAAYNGFLYVGDRENDRIRKVALSTNEVTTITNCSDGYVDGMGTAAKFFQPNGVSVSNGFLYVADSNNNRIRKLDLATNEVTTIAGQSTSGTTDGTGSAAQFYGPRGLVETNGSLYVADTLNHRIRQINLATNEVTTFAGSTPGTADGNGTAAQFNRPFGIATDDNFLYVVDWLSHHLRKINLATKDVTTIAGSTFGFADGIGTAAKFNRPFGVAVNNGFLYVADNYNHRIRKVDLATNEVITIAGQGTTATVDGIGTAAQFSGPFGVTVSNGSLYITDGASLRKLDLGTNNVTTVVGKGTAGYADGIGTAAQLRLSNGVVVSNGILYIGDSGNNVIRGIY